jgi:hypothetical protein
MVFEYFLHGVEGASERVRNWGIAVMAFAYVLGLTNLALVNIHHIRRRQEGWGYKVVLLAGVVTMLAAGLIGGEHHRSFTWQFDHIFRPLQATMFALLAFFIASAAFRAFRARSVEAALLLAAATLVMLGRVPIGEYMSGAFPWMKDFIMESFNNVGKRAILIGSALGAIATGLRVLLGLERSHLGGEG